MKQIESQQNKNPVTRLVPLLALTLTVASVLAMILPNESLACHNGKPHGKDAPTTCPDPGGGGGGDGESGNLAAKFCLDIAANLSIVKDGQTTAGHDYCDSKNDKVSILTGSQPGFNFESYSRRNGTWVRWVYLDFPGEGITAVRNFGDNPGDLDTFTDDIYKITYRFEKDLGGLDLGSLAVNASSTVSIWMGIETVDGKHHALMAHGSAPNPGTSGHLNGNACVGDTEDAVVTRKDKTTWTIETKPGDPGNVCLWDTNGGLEFQTGVPVNMPYSFEISIKN